MDGRTRGRGDGKGDGDSRVQHKEEIGLKHCEVVVFPPVKYEDCLSTRLENALIGREVEYVEENSFQPAAEA